MLGFDWHSSGVTTTVCGALKEAARKYGGDLGVIVCGGKGATSRKTPEDIRRACERTGNDAAPLVYASRMAAKVDSAAVQDGYQLYHHSFFFVPGGNNWCVVQQGMNAQVKYARRYHWHSNTMPSFVVEPHAAVACEHRQPALNLVAGEGQEHRHAVTKLSREHPERVLRELQPWLGHERLPLFEEELPTEKPQADLHMPRRHSIALEHLDPRALRKVLIKTYESQSADFEALVGEAGIGPMALRSLSLIAEIIYNAPASRRDPAAYSFAHGGKDGHPYVVNRTVYDANLERLRETIARAKIGETDKIASLKALAQFTSRLL